MEDITIEKVNQLKEVYTDFAKLNGILYRYNVQGIELINHTPFALIPYSIARQHYQKLRKIQLIWGKLLILLAHDKKKCNKLFQETIKTDNFVKKILELYNKTYDDNPQNQTFHILRSDYMLDDFKKNFFLIQYNTIAVSFGAISQKVQNLFKTLHPIYFKNIFQKDRFVNCNNISLIGDSLANSLKKNHLKGKVIIIVSEGQGNVFDQRQIQYQLLRNGYGSLRKTFKQLAENIVLDQQSRVIKYQNEQIAAFYFRDGYAPKSYENESIWQLREKIERSKAIKIPTLGMQLVNFKKVQQQFTDKNLLLEYLNEQQVNQILSVTAKMWNFQQNQNKKNIINYCEKNNCVLKPNREGGCNNIYCQKVIETLKTLSDQQLKAYVLMERIFPKPTPNYFFRKGEFHRDEQTISEFSIISAISSNGIQIIQNQVGGHLVRTKNEKSDEGGVAVGASVISSLYVI